jgi:hypothetical protein
LIASGIYVESLQGRTGLAGTLVVLGFAMVRLRSLGIIQNVCGFQHRRSTRIPDINLCWSDENLVGQHI